MIFLSEKTFYIINAELLAIIVKWLKVCILPNMKILTTFEAELLKTQIKNEFMNISDILKS